MQHSTLALSTTNLTAAHNIYCRNTQLALPKTNPKASVPATPCLYLKSYACCILFMYLQCTGGRRNSALTFLINILKMMLRSVYGFSLRIRGNFMVTTMIIFLKAVGFSHALVLVPLTWCFPNIGKSNYWLLSHVCLSVFLYVRTEQFVAQ